MYVNKKNPHGGDIYSHDILLDLSSNMNPAGTPDAVKAAVRASADSCAEYPDPYCRELRKAISGREECNEYGRYYSWADAMDSTATFSNEEIGRASCRERV